jgi:hypothetical protein
MKRRIHAIQVASNFSDLYCSVEMIIRWSGICILNRNNRHTAKDVVKLKSAKTVEESSIKIKAGGGKVIV